MFESLRPETLPATDPTELRGDCCKLKNAEYSSPITRIPPGMLRSFLAATIPASLELLFVPDDVGGARTSIFGQMSINSLDDLSSLRVTRLIV